MNPLFTDSFSREVLDFYTWVLIINSNKLFQMYRFPNELFQKLCKYNELSWSVPICIFWWCVILKSLSHDTIYNVAHHQNVQIETLYESSLHLHNFFIVHEPNETIEKVCCYSMTKTLYNLHNFFRVHEPNETMEKVCCYSMTKTLYNLHFSQLHPLLSKRSPLSLWCVLWLT